MGNLTNKEFRSELEIVLESLGRSTAFSEIGSEVKAKYLGTPSCRGGTLGFGSDLMQNEEVNKDLLSDKEYLFDLFIDYYFLSYDVLARYYDVVTLRRVMRGWLSNLTTWQFDLRSLGELLKFLEEWALTPMSDVEDCEARISYAALKATIQERFPTLLFWILPQRPALIGWAKKKDITSFQVVYQLASYLGRAHMKTVSDAEATSSDYMAFEQHLHSFEPDAGIIAGLRTVIRGWFDVREILSHLEEIVPKHGPGASFGEKRGRSLYYKYNVLSYESAWENYLTTRMFDHFLFEEEHQCSGVSEIVNVPKTMLKDRIISKEDITLQYLQHAVLNFLVGVMHDPNNPLSQHVDLRRPNASRDEARQGSIDGGIATVDLSAASDSVTCKIVKGAFPPIIKDVLFRFRSGVTLLPTGELCQLEKFAPMGAATCFPVETILFAAVVEYAYRLYKSRTGIHNLRNYRVYGDDCTVDTRVVPLLYELFADLGFKVNTRKSYSKSLAFTFREACGGEYVNGIDVKPLRVPRPRYVWETHVQSISQVTSITDQANSAFVYRYTNLRRLFIVRIKRTKVWVAPYAVSENNQHWCKGFFEPIFPHIHFVNELSSATSSNDVPWRDPESDPSSGPKPLELLTDFASNYNLQFCSVSHPSIISKFSPDCYGWQVSCYWGLQEAPVHDIEGDKAEVYDIWAQGVTPSEVDYVRWLLYWQTKLTQADEEFTWQTNNTSVEYLKREIPPIQSGAPCVTAVKYKVQLVPMSLDS